MFGKGPVNISFNIRDPVDSELRSFISVDGSRWRELGNGTHNHIEGLGDGRHDARISVQDEAGNIAYHDIYFLVDATPPGVIMLSPDDGKLMPDEPFISIDFTENMDVERTSVYLDGERVPVQWSTYRALTVNLDGYRSDDSAHNITVSGCDILGNEMHDETFQFQFALEEESITPVKEGSKGVLVMMVLILGLLIVSLLLVLGGVLIWKRRREELTSLTAQGNGSGGSPP